jgi:hypothetical protein
MLRLVDLQIHAFEDRCYSPLTVEAVVEQQVEAFLIRASGSVNDRGARSGTTPAASATSPALLT